MPKALRVISENDVDRIFDANCIRGLAELSKLSKDADIEKLGKEIRENARIYLKAASEPSANELHDEIKALHDASDKCLFEQTGRLIDNLSLRARSALIGRWEQTNPGTAFPQGNDLKNVDTRQGVCGEIAGICRIGGNVADARMRPSGRRSKTWEVLYYAPEKTRHFPKTAAEDQLVMHLAILWCDMTGKMPPRVVPSHGFGPFARLARECLELLGSNASAAKLINKYGQRRREP
jgi:hypothetical protein